MRSGDINDIRYRKLIINVLINKVYLYDDFIRVIFNTQDTPCESKVPTIESIEAQIKDKSSHKEQNCPPESKRVEMLIYQYFHSFYKSQIKTS